jgi:ribosome-binding factor A
LREDGKPSFPLAKEGGVSYYLDPLANSGNLNDFPIAMKHRIKRVCEALKRELGQIILRDITFPVPLVTINEVDITPDLKQAHVYVSALGTNGEKRQVMEILEKKRKHLQGEIAKKISLKNTPHLHFEFDEAMERGTRVINLMNELGLNE